MSEFARDSVPAEAAPDRLLLEAIAVAKNFYDGDREVQVLKALDFSLQAGERVAIVGQSGVGKSTLLHVLGSLEPPSAGKVMFLGRDLFALSAPQLAHFRNRSLGFIFQFHYLLGDFTALENVMMPGLIGRMPQDELRRQAAEMLAVVGLGDKFSRRPAELSGGEQQRVAVARAVVMRPKLVLADEPTGNLDPHTAEEVHSLFELLNRQYGISFVVATHNLELAASMDRTLRLKEGRLFREGRTSL